MPITALIFDLDDTLVPEHPADHAAIAATRSVLPDECEVGDEAFVELVLDAARAHWKSGPFYKYSQVIGTSSLEALWSPEDRSTATLSDMTDWVFGFRERVWREVALRAGAPPDTTWTPLNAMFQIERDRRHDPYPDVVPSLSRMRPRYSIGLLTNGLPRVQRRKAERAGLSDFFDFVVASGDYGSRKPDVLLFERMLDALNVKPSEAVMIGDRPGTDVAGAKAAGIRAIQINRPGNDHSSESGEAPFAVIESLDELDACLA